MAHAHRRFELILAVVFGLLWVLLAIHPHDRSDWLLENALVALAVGLLLGLRRRLVFSRVSYT